MRRLSPLFALFLALPALAELNPEWTTPLPPFQIADNLYYVGSQDLAAFLVTTPAGNVLINANLESSPPLIRASVEKLGFQWADTKILLNSQAHFDHMAGAAQILRETGWSTQQRTHLRENIIEDGVRKFDREAAAACAPIEAFDLITQHSTLHRQVRRQHDFERVAFDPARDRAK